MALIIHTQKKIQTDTTHTCIFHSNGENTCALHKSQAKSASHSANPISYGIPLGQSIMR